MQSKKNTIIGRVMSGLVILFMLFDSIFKFFESKELTESMDSLGFPEHHAATIGIIALVLTILYAIPRTALIGAILMTGYYGGAIAIHLRVDNPLFSHLLFPIYLSVLLWGGLLLRFPALKSFLLNKNQDHASTH